MNEGEIQFQIALAFLAMDFRETINKFSMPFI